MTMVPPVPAGMDAWDVEKNDGTQLSAVSIGDAARLVGVKVRVMEKWVLEGKIEIAFSPTREKLVVLESLWAFLPPELKEL